MARIRITNLWNRIDPDHFPRKQAWKLWWWFKSYTDINHIYFRIHGHWPTNPDGYVVSLKKKGHYETPESAHYKQKFIEEMRASLASE